MPSRSRYVLDANVIVSALLLPGSVPRQAFDEAMRDRRILLSPDVILELDGVLRRPRLDRYLGEEDRLRFLVLLIRDAEVIEATQPVRASRDPKDDKYLELAVAGNATCLVTGDADLLTLNPFRGIPVLTPREFLGLCGQKA